MTLGRRSISSEIRFPAREETPTLLVIGHPDPARLQFAKKTSGEVRRSRDQLVQGGFAASHEWMTANVSKAMHLRFLVCFSSRHRASSFSRSVQVAPPLCAAHPAPECCLHMDTSPSGSMYSTAGSSLRDPIKPSGIVAAKPLRMAELYLCFILPPGSANLALEPNGRPQCEGGGRNGPACSTCWAYLSISSAATMSERHSSKEFASKRHTLRCA